ncbi:MAG: Hsp70 family protein [Proteobacteria bacterium]|nr:Hsp70 family protein [Pseudomonadota bacterium]
MAQDDEIVLGIDLGTTFSAMAHVNRYGKPEIVTNAEGYQTTPSVVHFYDEDACIVGEEAVKMVVIDPHNVVRFIKRHMGEEHFTLDFFGRDYTPQEISALILRKLKEDAEELLGFEVKDAVVTVPAYFNSAQRGATAEAGQIAGLNVLSIINEPTAAAIAYGLDRIGGKRKLLVFDLGGGTFDVTVMEIRGTRLTTISSDGNAELGGKDWDDRLLNHVAEQFYEKFQLDPRDDAAPYQELYERCLNAKISLSSKERAVIPVNYRGQRMVVPVTRDQFVELTQDLVDQCEDTANIVLEKARLRWEDLDDVLLVGGSTRMPMIRDLLEGLAGKPAAEGVNPDECVSLGAALAGVFRHRPNHPALLAQRQQMVSRAKEVKRAERKAPAPVKAPEPVADSGRPKAAAIGLAYGGSRVAGGGAAAPEPEQYGLPGVTIEDATTHPLGIVVLDRNREERVVELIPAGTRVPHRYKGRFAYAYENMTAVRVEVTEGVGSRRDEVTVIGKVELTGLPPRPRGTPIEVIYSYGVDQILQVRVIDVETGKEKEAQIQFQGGMTSDQVSSARDHNRRMAVD